MRQTYTVITLSEITMQLITANFILYLKFEQTSDIFINAFEKPSLKPLNPLAYEYAHIKNRKLLIIIC